MTQAAAEALKIPRDGSQFQWYVIPLFALIVYIYAVEIERRRWSLVFAIVGAIYAFDLACLALFGAALKWI